MLIKRSVFFATERWGNVDKTEVEMLRPEAWNADKTGVKQHRHDFGITH